MSWVKPLERARLNQELVRQELARVRPGADRYLLRTEDGQEIKPRRRPSLCLIRLKTLT